MLSKKISNLERSRRVWRYQSGNQNPYIEEEQTTQWSKKKNKRRNNDLQTIHIKLKIEHHEPQWKSRVNLGAPEGSAIPAQHVAPVVSNDLKLHLIRWWWCQLSTRMTPIWIVIVLVHWKNDINVVPHGHIILNPSLWCYSLILHA